MQRAWKEGHYLITAVLQLAVAMLIFTICRALFFSYNQLLFPAVSGQELGKIFLQGLRFDLVAVAYINLPVILTYLLPLKQRSLKGYQIFQWLLFLFCNGLALFFELVDLAYFPYALRRTNAGDFGLIANTSDMLLAIAVEYWFLILLYFGLLFMLAYFSWKWKLKSEPARHHYFMQSLVFILGASFTLVAVRGGLQMRPLMPLNANQCVDDMRLAPLIYPSSLSLLFSAQQRFLEEQNYFSESELKGFFGPPKTSAEPMTKHNVCIIVLESFGKEYSSFFNNKKGYTPFLDSLMQEGYYCEYSFANGLRSTQGIAAITTGIPSLMNDPIMFSAYQSNQLQGLPGMLKKKGYTSGFFHGSNPGSMEFEDFSQLCGYDHFYDRTSYPDQNDYDGQWGIWDAPFFQFTANTIDKYPEPFTSLLFSLSSHHPYAVEDYFEQKHSDTPPLYRAVQYTDFALSKFFQTARNMDWFDNTLFIITADHTGQSKDHTYQTKLGKYSIPLLFYHPSQQLKGSQRRVASQIDILPSVLNYLQYDEPYQTFGNSVFEKTAHSYAVMYSNQVYQIIDERFILLFDEVKTIGLYDHIADPKLSQNLMEKYSADKERLERRIKAEIQRHHAGMIRNELGG